MLATAESLKLLAELLRLVGRVLCDRVTGQSRHQHNLLKQSNFRALIHFMFFMCTHVHYNIYYKNTKTHDMRLSIQLPSVSSTDNKLGLTMG